MTHDQMLAALSPVRLPTALTALSWNETLALLSLGLIAGGVLGAALLPLTRRRGPRARPDDPHALPVPERLLMLSRQLGHLPAALRAAAYGAAPPPSDSRIRAIARRARLRRPWRR